MSFLGQLLLMILNVYSWVIIISAVVSWLVAFQVLNIGNPQAGNLVRLLERVTEPVYKPLRRYIPPIGGVDITPIVVLFIIFLLQKAVMQLFMF